MIPKTSVGTEKRFDWIDIARGIGIILVVLQHVYRGIVHSHLMQPSSGWQTEDYMVHSFHMPLFFFLAGLNVEFSLAKGKRRFLEGKLWTIVYPYFLWSLLQGSIQLALAKYINNAPSAHDLLHILWRPIDQFWFLYTLLLCHLAAALLPKLRPTLLLITIAGFALSLFVKPPTFLIMQSLYMPLFYALGIVLADRVKNIAHISPFARYGGLLALWSGFAVVTLLAYRGGYPHWDCLQILPSSFLGIAGTIWIAKYLRSAMGSTIARWLIQLGKGSMAIYVMHVIAAAGIRVILKMLHVHPPMLHLLLGTMAGLLLPLLAQSLFKKFNLLSLAGLAPRAKRKTAEENRVLVAS